jgi:arylsulfatase A-like enzyme
LRPSHSIRTSNPILIAIAIALLGVLFAVACSPDAPAKKPSDVVIIVLDTTRADHLSIYGHNRPVSPNLEKFARDSVVYERAWSTASWTLPAHASLLTGQYPTAHGAHMTPLTDDDSNGKNPAHLRESATTLAELLVEREYRTAAFAGAGWLSPEFGLLQGYEVRDAENNRTLPGVAISNRALAWMKKLGEDEPMHLLLNYFDAHWPYDPKSPYDKFAKGKEHIRTPTLGDMFNGIDPTPEQIAKMRDLYDGEILYMDQHVGRVLDALRENGRYDDAMIVIIADHGEMFGEHGVSGHGAWLWEELTRIPLIVHYPGGRDGGTRNDSMVSTVDVLSWIGAELDMPLPADIDGMPAGERSLVLAQEFPNGIFLKIAGDKISKSLVAGVQWPWKLITDSKGRNQLFRLEDDPSETNAVDDEATIEILRQSIDATESALVIPVLDKTRTMSPEAEQQLRELGYLE